MDILLNPNKYAYKTIKDTNKYLVHGCLEGPEAGVYYRGKGEITNGHSLTIELPNYVNKLATNLSIQISAIYDGSELKTYNVSTVNNNKFTVYKNGRKVLSKSTFMGNKYL